jgi:malonyl-CoA O-methyltransferase
MIIKEKVKRNFSRGVKTYDKYAKTQRHMALVLEGFLGGNDEKLRILEIGSGTGIFTEYLLKKFPNAEIHMLDISEEMLGHSKEKFKDCKNLKYFLGDAECYQFTHKYDLIVSNASFQWFNNLGESIKRLEGFLKKDGELIFSIFADETYKELRDSFEKVDPKYNFSQKFRSFDEMRSYEPQLELLDEERYYEFYEDIFDFLKAIKNIGANSAKSSQKVLTQRKLKKIEEVYNKFYSREGKLVVTNHLLYLKLKKTTP